MDDFDRIVVSINKARKASFNVIPSFFNRFAQWFPGIMRALYTIITANSGVGKSIFTRKVYLYDPIEFIEKHPELEINFHAMVFLLEESKDSFIYKGISKQLWEKHRISISTRELKSFFNNAEKGIQSKVTDDIYEKILAIKPYFEKLKKYVELIDHIRNPTGIWMHIRKYAAAHGKFYWVEKDDDGNITSKRHIPDIFKKKSDGMRDPLADWNHYEPNDPDEFVLIIIDHISLAQVEKGTINLHGAMSLLSSEYLIRARNSFGYSPVVVQQQTSDKEKIETNFKGETNEKKLEPTLDSVGDNKLTVRDADCVYSIFGPARYGIQTHNEFDITKLGNSYRWFNCLKDRDGEPNVGIPLYFNGKVGEFTELEPAINLNYKKYPEIRADS